MKRFESQKKHTGVRFSKKRSPPRRLPPPPPDRLHRSQSAGKVSMPTKMDQGRKKHQHFRSLSHHLEVFLPGSPIMVERSVSFNENSMQQRSSVLFGVGSGDARPEIPGSFLYSKVKNSPDLRTQSLPVGGMGPKSLPPPPTCTQQLQYRGAKNLRGVYCMSESKVDARVRHLCFKRRAKPFKSRRNSFSQMSESTVPITSPIKKESHRRNFSENFISAQTSPLSSDTEFRELFRSDLRQLASRKFHVLEEEIPEPLSVQELSLTEGSQQLNDTSKYEPAGFLHMEHARMQIPTEHDPEQLHPALTPYPEKSLDTSNEPGQVEQQKALADQNPELHQPAPASRPPETFEGVEQTGLGLERKRSAHDIYLEELAPAKYYPQNIYAMEAGEFTPQDLSPIQTRSPSTSRSLPGSRSLSPSLRKHSANRHHNRSKSVHWPENYLVQESLNSEKPPIVYYYD